MESLSDRSQKLLKLLIERYLCDGLPVGSKTLASDASISLSPATIRNILSDLEGRGLLSSPHTSAGRVPTEHGLRFFIDSLVTIQPLPHNEVKIVRDQLDVVEPTENLINTASGLLSHITQLVGVVSTPRNEQQLLRMVEFLPLSKQRVLVILVINEQLVQNRIIFTDKDYSASELEEAAQYLNSVFSGKDLLEIRTSLLDLLRYERENLDRLMRTTIEVAAQAFEGCTARNDYVLAGEMNLLTYTEPQSTLQLRNIFEAFTQKQEILQLLDQCIKASGVQIFIGEEVGDLDFKGYSLVTAPYSINGQVMGALGVIGPTRMPYQRIISVVEVTAKLLSAALNPSTSTPTLRGS
jgi:heat-inducible transcriptional repressor